MTGTEPVCPYVFSNQDAESLALSVALFVFSLGASLGAWWVR